jgi:hypothetical protein
MLLQNPLGKFFAEILEVIYSRPYTFLKILMFEGWIDENEISISHISPAMASVHHHGTIFNNC